ncbi:hypothetical protein TNCV_2827031 [Trichonephila clavipes]|nr:hypothetical protein TNCV_2827031 [Trichonephila clavipes]
MALGHRCLKTSAPEIPNKQTTGTKRNPKSDRFYCCSLLLNGLQKNGERRALNNVVAGDAQIESRDHYLIQSSAAKDMQETSHRKLLSYGSFESKVCPLPHVIHEALPSSKKQQITLKATALVQNGKHSQYAAKVGSQLD